MLVTIGAYRVNEVRMIACKICTKIFKSWYGRARHMQIHHDVEYACYKCEFGTKRKQYLKLHIKQMHQRDNFPYNCEKYMMRYELNDHKPSHLDTKTFVCEDRDKASSQSSFFLSTQINSSRDTKDNKTEQNTPV